MYFYIASVLAFLIVAVLGAWESEVASGLEQYSSTITQQPEFTSAINFLATGVDRDILASITQNPAALIPVTTTPPWFTVLPTDVQSFLESAGSAELAISSSIVSSASSASEASSRYAATHTEAQYTPPKRNGGHNLTKRISMPSTLVLAIYGIVLCAGSLALK